MGISASLLKLPAQQRFESIFISDGLRHGCDRLKRNAPLRVAFTDFVKNGLWDNYLHESERATSLPGHSIWSKYGYKEHCQAGDAPACMCKTADQSMTSERSHASMGSGSVTQHSINEEKEQYDVLASLMMFKEPSDAMSLLVVLFFPIFEEAVTAYNTDSDFSGDSSSGTGITNPRSSVPRLEGNRLHEILLSISAACEDSALLAYLANPTTSITEDFQRAIESLPVKLMVGRVDLARSELPIVYKNFVLDAQSKAAMGLPAHEQSAIGQDLHVLCGNMCSPGSAQQLERAVFAGKTFKKSIALPNFRCKLLAICPINGTQPGKTGTPLYSVSLESMSFIDPHFLPTKGVCERGGEEVPFRQIEVMMALLPMLIRK